MGFPFEHGLHTTLIAMRLADRLGVDDEDVARTYYACLLSHSGCTTDAHVTTEVFGGSMTTTFHRVRYGSGREVLAGLIRTLPDPESRGLFRASQVARRLPRMAREMRPHLAATCEVAGMLAAGLGLPASVQELFDHRFERWDGRGPLGRAKGDADPAADADRPAFGGRRLPTRARRRGTRRAAGPRPGGARLRPGGRRMSRRPCKGDPRLGRARLGVGRGALLRAGPGVVPRGGGAGSRARGDGELLGSALAVSGGSLRGRGGADRSGCGALPDGRSPASPRSGGRRSSTTSDGSR